MRGRARGVPRGQSVMEYAMFTAVFAAALVAMGVYIRRSMQANLKTVEDRINADAVRAPSGSGSDPGPVDPGPVDPGPPQI